MRTTVAWVVAVGFIGGLCALLSWHRDAASLLQYLIAAGAFTLLAKSIFERGKKAGAAGAPAGYFGFAFVLGLLLVALLVFQPILPG